MSDVYPYALLLEDPTSEMGISWIDDTGESGGASQTVSYGTEPDALAESEEAEGEEFPESDGAYVYHTTLTGLEPDTTYHIEIDATDSLTHQFNTFPLERPEEMRIGITSDHHPWREGIGMADAGNGAAVMEEFGQFEPDIVYYPGDFVTFATSHTTEDTENWLTWFDDYMGGINQGYLKPFFAGAGNHELAEIVGCCWEGRKEGFDYEDLTPDAGYFQMLFPNIVELDPVGENYGSVTISDYLQLVMLDSHSAFVDDQAEWLAETIDPSVDLVVPGCHQPMLPGGDRGSYELMASMRSLWGPILHEAPNVQCYFVGNEHAYKNTLPWTIVDDEPDHDNYFDLDDEFFDLEDVGYMVVDDGVTTTEDTITKENGIIEFGDGWPNNRAIPSEEGDWFLNYAEGDSVDEAQYQLLDIYSESMTISEVNQVGEAMASFDFELANVEGDGAIVQAGETLVVEAEVTNDGDEAGTQEITMLRDSSVVDSVSDVEIDPGESETVVLEWDVMSGHEGTWEIEVVSDDESDSIEVTVPSSIGAN
ncbi:fibronectin type III domain-containing protein [Halobacteria archaeon AArc-dxtr1]|nr:fibronectin type III domain-containing protein [Halobacteria archaeon AArc-dxtr1]